MDSRGPQTENINVAGNEAFRPVYETASFTTAWDIIWHLNDLFTFENNLVYADFSYDRYTNPNSRGDFNTDGKEFHIEPLLRYIALDGSVNALIGARYYQSSQDDMYIDAASAYPMDGRTKAKSVLRKSLMR